MMSMKIGTTDAGSKAGSSARRHHTPSAMIISMVTAPSRSTSAGMSPCSTAALQQVAEPFLHVDVEGGGEAGDLGIAARLGHHLGAQQHLLVRLLGEMVMRHAFEHGKEAVGKIGAGELLREFGAVALGDAGDERLLGREIAVEIAGAHPRFGADVLHRGAVEAGAHETSLRRSQDFVPAVIAKLHIGAAHQETPLPVLRCGKRE